MLSSSLPPASRLQGRSTFASLSCAPALCIILLLFLLGGSGRARATDQPAASGDAKAALSSAPDFTAEGCDGRTYRLSELLKQGPVFLDFWTTYCKPCMLELPHLQKIWEANKEKGFTLLGVASDDQRSVAKIKPTIKAKGFKFPNVIDPDHKIGSLYNVGNYPTSVLIAPDGRIVVYSLGYTPGDEKQVEQKILELLATAKKGAEQGKAEGK